MHVNNEDIMEHNLHIKRKKGNNRKKTVALLKSMLFGLHAGSELLSVCAE